MTSIVLSLLVLSAIGSTALTWLCRAIGRRRSWLDSGGAAGHEKSLRGVPNIGGIAIFWTIVLPVAIGLALVWADLPGPLTSRLPALEEHLAGVRSQTPLALGLIGCLLALHLVGVADDRRALGPLPKLLVMLVAALVMALVFDVRLLSLLDERAGGTWLSILLTLAWLVMITNALNFLDNMDGLASGVGIVAGALFLAAALANGQWFVSAMLALLVGALVGFFVFNAPRPGGATIFMGDSGSLVVGFLLAFLTVRTTYVGGEGPTASVSAWYGLFMPLCVLAVPVYDLLSVVAIRLAQGRKPWIGDRQHFSHRLLQRGLSVRHALVVICGCTAITGIGGVLLTRAEPWQAVLIGLQTILVLFILAIFELASAPAEASA